MKEIASNAFFNLGECPYRELFLEEAPPWTALDRLAEFLETFFKSPWPLSGITGLVEKPLVIYKGAIQAGAELRPVGPRGSMRALAKGELLEGAAIVMPGAYLSDDRIILGEGTVVEPGAMLKGPAVFGRDAEIRQGAYVRGDCLVGSGCVVGHTTEIKGSVMLDGAKAGHFAYIGDSILGSNVNLGAGTKLANLRVISGNITVACGKAHYETGRRKLGAILGDGTETGCNSVTSPGTLLGPRSIVYPCVAVPGGGYPCRTLFMPSRDGVRIISRG